MGGTVVPCMGFGLGRLAEDSNCNSLRGAEGFQKVLIEE